MLPSLADPVRGSHGRHDLSPHGANVTTDRELQDTSPSELAPVPLEACVSSDPPADGSIPPPEDLLPAPPTGWTDVPTGMDGPRYWDRVITSEQARLRRYRRPATIALAEIAGLDVLATRWGRDVADRLFVKLARALAGEVRSSDYIARIERTRFAVYLTETDEIGAINFVERARASCEALMGLARDDVRVGIGWASPPPKGGLSDAHEIAAERLAADLGRPD
jgi:diguanylate cyclase (GGDEF)-like protein